jgi:glycosyltransferase involved in cell wall biosynthesis
MRRRPWRDQLLPSDANGPNEPRPRGDRVSLVIPAFNEAEGIGETLREANTALAALSLADHEIIVVDDGSVDATAELAAAAPGVRVVRHPKNAGYGRSLKSGIAAARFETIIIADADLTYPLDAMGELLAEYRKGFDMVVGARTGGHYRESAIKAPMRALLRFMVEYTSGKAIPDVNSGLRVFDKNTVATLFSRLSNGFSFTTSVTLAYLMTGRFVTWHPIPYRGRKGRTKVRLLRDSLRTLQYIVEAAVYYNPLKIFMLLAGLTLVGSVIGFAVSALLHLAVGYFLGIAGILLAALIFALGLLAVLLKQIMDK